VTTSACCDITTKLSICNIRLAVRQPCNAIPRNVEESICRALAAGRFGRDRSSGVIGGVAELRNRAPDSGGSAPVSRRSTDTPRQPVDPPGRPVEPTRRAVETPRRSAEPTRHPAETPRRSAEPARRPAEPTGRRTEPMRRPAEPARRSAETPRRPVPDTPRDAADRLRLLQGDRPRRSPYADAGNGTSRRGPNAQNNRGGLRDGHDANAEKRQSGRPETPPTGRAHGRPTKGEGARGRADTPRDPAEAAQRRGDGTAPGASDQPTISRFGGRQPETGQRASTGDGRRDDNAASGLVIVPRQRGALPDEAGHASPTALKDRDASPGAREATSGSPARDQAPTPDRPHVIVDRPNFRDEFGKLEPPDRYGDPLTLPDGSRMPTFNGLPSRDQIRQGAIGDCGVVATLGAVAACRPGDIAERIREQADGSYIVRLDEAAWTPEAISAPTGQTIELTVTPDLPVYDLDPTEAAFAKPQGGAAWGAVLEKAIAGIDQTWNPQEADNWSATWDAVCTQDINNGVEDPRSGPPPTGYVRLNQGSTPWERAELLTQLTGQQAAVLRSPDKPADLARRLDFSDRQKIVYAAAVAGVMPRSWKRSCMPMRRVS
jgi:hypothetical protein